MTATQREKLNIIETLEKFTTARFRLCLVSGTTHQFVAVRELYDALVIDRSLNDDAGHDVAFLRGPNWNLAQHISADIRNGNTK